GDLPEGQRPAGRGRPHRGQLHPGGGLRRCRAGAEAALRFSAVSGQPRAGEAVPGPGGPEGVCR
ncbi:Transcriptional regulator, partial [Dysosmobacter welbionis]